MSACLQCSVCSCPDGTVSTLNVYVSDSSAAPYMPGMECIAIEGEHRQANNATLDVTTNATADASLQHHGDADGTQSPTP